jgi:AraC-like DNA-binding protein
LEECRRDLAKPTARSATVAAIAAIARRWGFPDPTHFSRAFKDAYGVSPRQWREQRTTPEIERTAPQARHNPANDADAADAH